MNQQHPCLHFIPERGITHPHQMIGDRCFNYELFFFFRPISGSFFVAIVLPERCGTETDQRADVLNAIYRK
jgi:hypothetical protein